MTHEELVKLLIPGTKIKIKGVPFTVKQHIVWMQHRLNSPYDKWVLVDKEGNDGYRMYIEVPSAAMGFAKVIHYDFAEPLPQQLDFNG